VVTRADVKVLCLAYACPFCHAEAGRKCQRTVARLGGNLVTQRPMQHPHIERMLKVPEWAAQEKARKEASDGQKKTA
jgi:hypothetical protein